MIEAKQRGEAKAQIRKAEIDAGAARNDDDVEGAVELLAVVAEPFTDATLEEIALHGRPGLATDRDPEPALLGPG